MFIHVFTVIQVIVNGNGVRPDAARPPEDGSVDEKLESMNKEQKKFWDLLRMPYKKHCHNCIHIRIDSLSWTCHINADDCNPVSWEGDPPYQLRWEWDGKNQ